MPAAGLKSCGWTTRLNASIVAGQNRTAICSGTHGRTSRPVRVRPTLGLVGDEIAGYYTLSVGHVMPQEAPDRLTKGLARHPVPIMLLARLAVDCRWQGKGVGKALLCDAMLRTLQAAEIAGIRAFAMHAKDEAARNFYRHFDLIESPADPMHLVVLLKDDKPRLASNGKLVEQAFGLHCLTSGFVS